MYFQEKSTIVKMHHTFASDSWERVESIHECDVVVYGGLWTVVVVDSDGAVDGGKEVPEGRQP